MSNDCAGPNCCEFCSYTPGTDCPHEQPQRDFDTVVYQFRVAYERMVKLDEELKLNMSMRKEFDAMKKPTDDFLVAYFG